MIYISFRKDSYITFRIIRLSITTTGYYHNHMKVNNYRYQDHRHLSMMFFQQCIILYNSIFVNIIMTV